MHVAVVISERFQRPGLIVKAGRVAGQRNGVVAQIGDQIRQLVLRTGEQPHVPACGDGLARGGGPDPARGSGDEECLAGHVRLLMLCLTGPTRSGVRGSLMQTVFTISTKVRGCTR